MLVFPPVGTWAKLNLRTISAVRNIGRSAQEHKSTQTDLHRGVSSTRAKTTTTRILGCFKEAPANRNRARLCLTTTTHPMLHCIHHVSTFAGNKECLTFQTEHVNNITLMGQIPLRNSSGLCCVLYFYRAKCNITLISNITLMNF